MKATKVNLVSLCDVDTILGLPLTLPMLESINTSMKFVHAKDVFMCDYITIIQIYQIDLYKIYNGPHIWFQLENFSKFMDVVANTSCRITQDWVSNLNNCAKHVCFYIIG